MGIKKMKVVVVAMFAALVFFGCSSDDKSKGGDENFTSDIAFKRLIDLSKQEVEGMEVKLQDVKWHNGKIYAALQYFIVDGWSWIPSANSKILELNESGEVLRTFESNFMNVNEIKIRNNNLFVLDVGSTMVGGDGGITKIDLTTGVPMTLFNGSTKGADVNKIEFIADNDAYILLSEGFDESWNPIAYVAKFNPNSGVVGNKIDINSVSDISYNETTKDLWIGSGSKVYRYSTKVDFEKTTRMPLYSIKSAGATTITIETDYTAGVYGVIVSDNYSEKRMEINGDPIVDFVDGYFFILDRKENGNKLSFLTDNGEIIRQLPFNSPNYNASAVCGNGNGKIFVSSYGDLTIAEFEVTNR